MNVSRRQFGRFVAGAGAAATLGHLGLTQALAQTSNYRAMVCLFLYGGNDGFNMLVPTDGRYASYASQRGASIALPQNTLSPLQGTAFGLHPSLARLAPIWDEGALAPILNVGSLVQPLTRATYQQRGDLRPDNLMSHSHQQLAWEGMRMKGANPDGVFGRVSDRMAGATTPAVISLGGSRLALVGRATQPLVLPSTGTVSRTGFNAASTDAAVRARQAALTVFANAGQDGDIALTSNRAINDAYAQIGTANGVIGAASSSVDQFFRDPVTGNALTSDIARQLQRIARLIEARGTLGNSRQTFFAAQGGYDTHDNQADAGSPQTGFHANLLTDLANAVRGFYEAMKALGVGRDVTLFTASDFGRIYKGNASRGTDHAWGNIQFVVSQALSPRQILGSYPDQQFGGAMDIGNDGKWIPGISIEQYVGAIANWYGVAAADLPYLFPNWQTWSSSGRSPLALYGVGV
jgi:uncharacterized protein (DUF1501 family)